jgi:hypothetical protein
MVAPEQRQSPEQMVSDEGIPRMEQVPRQQDNEADNASLVSAHDQPPVRE